VVHVSRTLSQLDTMGLVTCVNPEMRRRGRIYATTELGNRVVKELQNWRAATPPSGFPVGGPRSFQKGGRFHQRRVHGAVLERYLAFVRHKLGPGALGEILQEVGLGNTRVLDERWYPMEVFEGILKAIEKRWEGPPGKGCEEAAKYVARLLGSIRQQVVRAMSIEDLAERAPIVWNKEFNFGRLEVLVGKGWAVFSHHDWSPCPESCSVQLGAYSGILESISVPGSVVKTKCLRRGDDRCEYYVRWDQPVGAMKAEEGPLALPSASEGISPAPPA
jgi:hypothetical protein